MISLIIPIYNRAYLIEETIQSIISQSYTKWECIIVDDRSEDNTLEIVKQLTHADKRFSVFERPKILTKGPSSCRNYGITKAKGDYIQFFDSDDVMHPNHLQFKKEAIKNNDAVVCQLKSFKGKFNANMLSEKDASLNITLPENNFEAFATGSFPMMMVAPLWKINSIKPYLPIREDLHILEDHELYARALFDTKKIAIVNQPLIFYRIGEASSTNSFYSNVNYGLNSYFEAKRTVLKLSKAREIKLAILKMTLGFFRQALAERNIEAAEKCLVFIREEQLCYNFNLILKFFRIGFFYAIFKVVKKGDTKFKYLFKL